MMMKEQRLAWIGDEAPSFRVDGDDIEVLYGPEEFYSTLLSEIKAAKQRISLASLYLGTEHKEQKLIDSIADALRLNDDLEVKVLLDYNRGIRSNGKDTSSKSLLQTLTTRYPDNVKVSLFHTPDLRGLYKRLLPERWNEIVGLAHIKLYIFDDNVIISGANLSETYFTDRQDRYIIVRNAPDLVEFFCRLVDTVASLSFDVDPRTGDLSPPRDLHPFLGDDNGESFRQAGHDRVQRLLDDAMHTTSTVDGDTVVYPLLQMAPFSITADSAATGQMLRTLKVTERCYLASGYFNLTPAYMDDIVDTSHADFRLLYASPEANGFHGAKGSSAFIPSVYTTISRRFLDRLLLYTPERDTHHRIELYEYKRNNWSFHGKGIWLYDKEETLPFATFIGSPNFGARSVQRDLEVQLVMETSNEKLRLQLHKEKEELYKYSEQVTRQTFQAEERSVPLWVKAITGLIRSYF